MVSGALAVSGQDSGGADAGGRQRPPTARAGIRPRLEPEVRHEEVVALTVAIPAELVPTLKVEINAFQERLLDLCDSSEADAEQVYQFNMQLFPLSKRL